MKRKIVVEVIPHGEHRYPTVGDYWIDADGTLQIRVSDMGNEFYEDIVGIHEWAEYVQLKKRGIPISSIDNFDKAFEANRPEGNTDEPGDEVNAPYRNEHCLSTGIERILCAVLNIPWKEYEATIEALP